MMKTDRLSLRILTFLLSLCLLLPLVSCGETPADTAQTTVAATVAATTAEPAKYTVRLNAPASTAIHTDLQASYLADKDPLTIKSYMRSAYSAQSVNFDDSPGTIELSRPAAIKLTWEVETDQPESDIVGYTLSLWHEAAPDAALTATFSKLIKEYGLINALIGETYCWTITVIDKDGKNYTSQVGRFTTEDQAPRNIYVDGVTNVRDLGGWKTEDGGRIRQGLLYRGGRIVENSNALKVLITGKGIKTLRDDLGVKSEIDLRLTEKLGGLSASALGSTVAFYSCPMYDDWSKMFSDENNLKQIRKIFSLMADENNYPFYFHCSIGTDRTGLIAWLVNGLCGVSEEDLWRDYLFSNFGKIKNSRSTGVRDVYVDKLKTGGGKTYAEQIYNYLKNTIRVPAADLDAVIRIMKEPAPN